ncbi:MAG: hypothetical protein WBV47_08270 [Salegentibacter sp.]
MSNEERPVKRNIWHLVLGIIFLGYGCYRTWFHLNAAETDTFGLILAIGFVAFGVYDIYQYYRGTPA